MWIRSILKQSVIDLERKLRHAIEDRDRTVELIKDMQSSLPQKEEIVSGYREALKILNERSNDI